MPVVGICSVAPFTGAWIEIKKRMFGYLVRDKSHPSRVRGLKYLFHIDSLLLYLVAPFTGAWIEISVAI